MTNLKRQMPNNNISPANQSKAPSPTPDQSGKLTAPMRIFLSYGHDDNIELVNRIKSDLKARGHDIWFDLDKINHGNDWRQRITEGIINSDCVISILSKHSTRNPGVCLDELKIALGYKHGNIFTILVESEEDVMAPASIRPIQWLDMHDWKKRLVDNPDRWDEWYKAKVDEIFLVIESKATRMFTGEIEKLKVYLKPVSSDTLIVERMKKKFIGRKWVFDKLDKWMVSRERVSRLFLIEGVAGVGKSAIVAQLAHYGRDKVLSAQFMEWNKPDRKEARRVIRSLAFNLATRLPDYRDLILKLPEIDSLDSKNASELFDYLITGPLQHAIDGGRERCIVVIDALDEATEGGRNEIAELFARDAGRLPDWIGIVVTSRPESEIKETLKGLKPFIIKTGAEDNRKDIKEYLIQELAQYLSDRSDADAIIDKVIEKSEGVFLYVAMFVEAVTKPEPTLSLDYPEDFPLGLGGMFHQYFLRKFPDIEKYKNEVRPALRAILAAREPLPTEVLGPLFGWGKEELNDFMLRLGSLFPTANDGGIEVVKPYHKSLLDWLSDKEKSSRYFVSVEDGHRKLAELGLSLFSQKPRTTHSYLLKWLPAHLLITGEDASLIVLLKDFVYLLEKIRHNMIERLLEDFRGLPARFISDNGKLQIESAFFSERAHILRRGSEEWPVYKIFLQLAVEHADDSPLTVGAEKWLAEGNCDWVWLRRNSRPSEVFINPCKLVLEGHEHNIEEVIELSGNRVISWSDDRSCRIWDTQTGNNILTLDSYGTTPAGYFGDSCPRPGVIEFLNGKILLWGINNSLIMVDLNSRTVEKEFKHKDTVRGALLLSNGRFISWSEDQTARIWDIKTGDELKQIQFTGWGYGARMLSENRIVIWEGVSSHLLHILDAETGNELALLNGHEFDITDVLELPNKYLLSWNNKEPIRFWAPDGSAIDTGEPYGSDRISDLRRRFKRQDGTYENHVFFSLGNPLMVSVSNQCVKYWNEEKPYSLPATKVHGLKMLLNGSVVMWSSKNFYVLSLERGVRDSRWTGILLCSPMPKYLEGEYGNSCLSGILELSDGDGFCFWGDNKIWLQKGSVVKQFNGYSTHIKGVIQLSKEHHGGNILSWSKDGKLRVWDTVTGQQLHVLKGHNGRVMGAREMSDGRIISYSSLFALSGLFGKYLKDDTTIRIWEISGDQIQPLSSNVITRFIPVSDDKIFAYGSNESSDEQGEIIWIYDVESGEEFSANKQSKGSLKGALSLPDEMVVTFGKDDCMLRVWDGDGDQIYSFPVPKGADSSCVCDNGLIITFGNDSVIRVWSEEGEIASFKSNDHIDGWKSFASSIAYWHGKYLYLLDFDALVLVQLAGHTDTVLGVNKLQSGLLLSWGKDSSIRIWDPETARNIAVLDGISLIDTSHIGNEGYSVEGGHGIVELSDGSICWASKSELIIRNSVLSVESNRIMCGIWDYRTNMVQELKNVAPSKAVAEFDDLRLVFFPADGYDVQIFNRINEKILMLKGHSDKVIGVLKLDAQRLLTWGMDGLICIWDVAGGRLLNKIKMASLGSSGDHWDVSSRFDNRLLNCIWGKSYAMYNPDHAGAFALWHSEYDIAQLRAYESGTVVVSTSYGINFLKLYRGNRPCDLECFVEGGKKYGARLHG
jgi:WD40 repeat protein